MVFMPSLIKTSLPTHPDPKKPSSELPSSKIAGSKIVASKIVGQGEMAGLIRNFDWANSPLGPIETWPETLLTTVNLLLSSRHPMFLWWGRN
jgi:hypothetical protein